MATSSTIGNADQQSAVFAASFVIVWVGAGVITLNAMMLGGTLYGRFYVTSHFYSGFFQSVSILGYCVFPLMISAFICLYVPNTIARSCMVVIFVAWSVVCMPKVDAFSNDSASIGFFAGVVPEGKKALAMYPVVLFYVVLGWMVVLSTNPVDGPSPAPQPQNSTSY